MQWEEVEIPVRLEEEPSYDLATIEEKPITKQDVIYQNYPPAEKIEQLIAQLGIIYGDLFLRRLEVKGAANVLMGIFEINLNGITSEMIDKGLQKCCDPYGEFAKYPPSPIEFARLCLPEPDDLGIPSVSKSFQEYYNQGIKCYQDGIPFKDESVKRTIEEIGWRKLKEWHDQMCWNAWCEEYPKVVKKMMQEYHAKLKAGLIKL